MRNNGLVGVVEALVQARARLRNLGLGAPELILRVHPQDMMDLRHDPNAPRLMEADPMSRGRYQRLAGHLVLVSGAPIDAAQELEDENERLRTELREAQEQIRVLRKPAKAD